jgi:iron complex outermembrane receptor protein
MPEISDMSEAANSKKQGSNLSHNLIRNSVHAAVWAALAAASAAAQAQTAPAGGDTAALQEVVVTGSRLKRTDTETPSPIQIISDADLKQSGYTTISEVLRELTANGQGTLSNGFPGAFAGGATGVSLRGLNTSATLVMIDGHRMAPYPLSDDNQRSFVDVSSIPFDAVERVEVLKDGASAVYGSDAMAGVVNIILKKSFVGTTTSAEIGTADERGGTAEHATLMHGMGDLAADGYNAYVSLEYRHSSEIDQSQRLGDGRWSSFDQTSIGGINSTPGLRNAAIGAPVPPALGTVYLTAPGTYSAATSDFYATAIKPNPNYTGTCTFAIQAAGGCGFINPHAEIQPATENINFLASLKKKLGDTWLLDFKGSVFNSRGEQYGVSATGDGMIAFPTSLSQQVAMSAGNPAHLAGAAIPAITVPANYPGNTLGVAAFVRGIIPDAPTVHTDYNSLSYRFVGDLTGNVLGWDIDSSLGYTRINLTQSDHALVDRLALFNALNRATNPYLITAATRQQISPRSFRSALPTTPRPWSSAKSTPPRDCSSCPAVISA